MQIKKKVSPLVIVGVAILVLALVAGGGFLVWRYLGQRAAEEVKEEPLETFRVMFIPGRRLDDAKSRLVEAGYGKDEVEAAFAKKYDHAVLKDKPEWAGLDGYIYPDTYEFYVGTSVEKIVGAILDELWTAIKVNDLESKWKAQGFNVYQAITLASVVEREVVSVEDRAKVAQVFEKRLEMEMKLQSCATQGFGSEYDTYERNGLPIGPIGSPALTALVAVAEPADTDYLYFVSGDDGVNRFSYTYAEHEWNVSTYCKENCS